MKNINNQVKIHGYCDDCGEWDELYEFRVGKKTYKLCIGCLMFYELVEENVKVEIVGEDK